MKKTLLAGLVAFGVMVAYVAPDLSHIAKFTNLMYQGNVEPDDTITTNAGYWQYHTMEPVEYLHLTWWKCIEHGRISSGPTRGPITFAFFDTQHFEPYVPRVYRDTLRVPHAFFVAPLDSMIAWGHWEATP